MLRAKNEFDRGNAAVGPTPPTSEGVDPPCSGLKMLVSDLPSCSSRNIEAPSPTFVITVESKPTKQPASEQRVEVAIFHTPVHAGQQGEHAAQVHDASLCNKGGESALDDVSCMC